MISLGRNKFLKPDVFLGSMRKSVKRFGMIGAIVAGLFSYSSGMIAENYFSHANRVLRPYISQIGPKAYLVECQGGRINRKNYERALDHTRDAYLYNIFSLQQIYSNLGERIAKRESFLEKCLKSFGDGDSGEIDV